MESLARQRSRNENKNGRERVESLALNNAGIAKTIRLVQVAKKLKQLKKTKHLETILTFTRPRPSEGAATVDLVAKDGGTEVTWGMTGPMPYPINIMTLMMIWKR
jgi:hypothetical protein